MAKYLDLRGPIAACTVYASGRLVARDVTVTLPAVTPTTGELRGMGTIEVPTPTQLEAMELALTKLGIDKELGPLADMKAQDIEIRWVQDVMKSDGSTAPEGCKAFLRAMSKGLPGLSVEPGSPSENEITFSVLRYQLYVGGKEIVLADKLNAILRVNGKNYTSVLESLL